MAIYIYTPATEKEKPRQHWDWLYGLKEVAVVITQNKFDMVILDEICVAIHYHLFGIEEVLVLLKSKPVNMEIVMTGRYAPSELYAIAELVTEMTEVKHYYHQGIEARKGIEY